ncbi:YcbX family protein [Acerihabitans arboris]|uniref:MOSC domain-containing protein n=1 Tax=Acerihabitans arboris TaxID=2691583 RepID=A0A845SB80_9GAMM|nr:YcbX family protein [Acerihabitans arboris]NDL62000.1 MOSC domain-containing protein [Acerihabitans arboris]
MVSLSRLYIHPVKSMRGLQVSHALVGAEGLAFDRIFMVTEPDGTFITARQYPQMVLFTPVMVQNGLHLSAPDGQSVLVRFTDFTPDGHPTEVWGNHFTAYLAPEAINNWLSGYLGRPAQLRWTGEQSRRRVKRYPGIPLSFADGYPFLLVGEASLLDLQGRCPAGVRMTQFRPNMVVAGSEPYAEDGWRRIRIGGVEFELVKPCSRCVLTTVGVESGRRHPATEPLRTLQGYRTADNGDVDFGQNLIARSSGMIRVGDSVEVLAEREPRRYGTGKITEPLDRPAAGERQVRINYRGQQFTGNNRQVLLEQLEQQGVRIPYSCRAGICGTCRVELLEGEVAPLKASALEEPGHVLTCSCVPKSDLRLG